MAVVVPAQAPASRAFTLSAAAGASPAAQALAPKKPSGFLQLFRRLAGAGRKAPLQTAPGQGTDRGKTRTSEAGELRAQAAEIRAGRKPRRFGEARQGARQALPGLSGAEAAALPATAPARRARGSSPQEAVAPTEVRHAPLPAQARVFVLDLRARAAAGQAQPGNRREAEAPERGEASRGFERVLSAREAGNAVPGGVATLASAAPAASRPPSAPGLSGPALRERLLPEIVRQAGIVLRDGGEGEIRLVLKPEHLGSVRIRLQLGESSLEGRIVVDNSNVKELLDANLEQLKSALRQEGWASANIDVTVSGGGGRRDLPPEPAPPAVSGRTAGQFERATPVALDLGFTTVNLLA